MRRAGGRAGFAVAAFALVVALVPAAAAAAVPPPVPPLPLPLLPGATLGGGSWIVALDEGASVDAVARDARAPVRQRFSEALRGFSAVLDGGQVERLRADPRVRSVTEDSVVARLPADADLPAPAPSTQIVPSGVRRVGAAASRTARVDGVDQPLDADIAVLDGGVGPHNDLNVAASVDCVGDGQTRDTDGHGTEVAGVAAARDNRLGVVGVALGARVWNIRVFGVDGTATSSSLLCGLDQVRRNAARIDVAVMAYGGGSSDRPTTCGIGRVDGAGGRPRIGVADPIHLATCRARAAGVLLVAAAGNEAKDTAGFVPARYPEVLAVSAMTDTDGARGGRGPAACLPTERDDTFATYSNYGRVVDLAAPGTCVVTTFSAPFAPNAYTIDNGTSFAAPHVAGAAALLEAGDRRSDADSMTAALQRAKERTRLPGDPDGVAEGIVAVSGF